jgi:hypothetical protein
MRDVFRAVDRVADRLAHDLDCKPGRPKVQPPRSRKQPKPYVWRAPDAVPSRSKASATPQNDRGESR